MKLFTSKLGWGLTVLGLLGIQPVGASAGSRALLPMDVHERIEDGLLGKPVFEQYFGKNVDLGQGVFCQKLLTYNGKVRLILDDVQVDIDDDFNTTLLARFTDFDLDAEYYRKGSMCFWTGASGRVKMGSIATKVFLKVVPGEETPLPDLKDFQIQDLRFEQVKVHVPFFTWINGDAPQYLNHFVEKNINRLSQWALESWLGRQLEKYLTEELRRRLKRPSNLDPSLS